MQGIEQELKWTLEPEGHALLAGRLAAELGPPHLLEQRNRFLDSADRRLRRAGGNLRLRAEDGGTLLTVKGRLGEPGADGLHRHSEWERRLDAAAFAADPAAVAGWELPPAVAAALAGAPLTDLGGFANRRLEWHAGGDLLCLDATAFAHRIDHELEIETGDPQAAARWGQRLAEWGVWFEPQPLTKFARFLTAGGPPRQVLAWGDSLTAGCDLPAGERGRDWPATLARWSGGRLAVANHGRGGRPSGDRAGLAEALAEGAWDAVVVLLGANDAREIDGGAPERVAANLRLLAEQVRAAAPRAALVLAAPPNVAPESLGPSRAIGPQRQDNLRRMEAPIRALAAALGAGFVPLFGRIPPARLARDGVHPDGAGTDIIARALLRALERAGV